MSVFIVDKKTYQDIYATFWHLKSFKPHTTIGYCIGKMINSELPEKQSDFLKETVQSWYDTNKMNYVTRYECDKDMLRDANINAEKLKFKYGKIVDDFQLYKSLRCVSYQICDYFQSVADQINKIAGWVAQDIACSLPEYERANWG